MRTENFKRILIAAVMFVWIIAPDFIPGPIDDVIAFVYAVSNIKSIESADA